MMPAQIAKPAGNWRQMEGRAGRTNEVKRRIKEGKWGKEANMERRRGKREATCLRAGS